MAKQKAITTQRVVALQRLVFLWGEVGSRNLIAQLHGVHRVVQRDVIRKEEVPHPNMRQRGDVISREE